MYNICGHLPGDASQSLSQTRAVEDEDESEHSQEDEPSQSQVSRAVTVPPNHSTIFCNTWHSYYDIMHPYYTELILGCGIAGFTHNLLLWPQISNCLRIKLR